MFSYILFWTKETGNTYILHTVKPKATDNGWESSLCRIQYILTATPLRIDHSAYSSLLLSSWMKWPHLLHSLPPSQVSIHQKRWRCQMWQKMQWQFPGSNLWLRLTTTSCPTSQQKVGFTVWFTVWRVSKLYFNIRVILISVITAHGSLLFHVNECDTCFCSALSCEMFCGSAPCYSPCYT